jgi:uncharacterized protein YegP (UPF0339 family)
MSNRKKGWVEISYPTGASGWSWAVKAGNGAVVAQSDQAYTTPASARRGLYRLANILSDVKSLPTVTLRH